MKKILIALDYDPTAQKVAEIGFSLGENQHAEITLLHVIDSPSYYGSTVYDPIMGFGGYTNLNMLAPDIINELKKTSLNFLEKSKQHLGDDTIKILVKEGSVEESILEASKELNADIIVMGSHSRRWLENILIGSITEYVLHHSAVPLFIIPTKKQG
ncbi:MAG: universal stress protein [Saprospiraceae bacterium]